MSALLEVTGLTKRYSSHGRVVQALDNVSFSIAEGETLAVVGPSGSGKSTLSRVITRLVSADAGSVRFAGTDWLALPAAALRRERPRMQMVFQDPLEALNPRATVFSAIADPLRIHRLVPRREFRRAVIHLLDKVQLPASLLDRAVHEISGGQRQRVALARALACQPRLIVLDEAVSALDVSLRARIIDLLIDLQRAEKLSYLFVSHDLAVVKATAHRTAVMEAGRIVEIGPTPALINAPQSEMARALIAAVPRLNLSRTL
ncbi:ATP-binding cassette domain-containing protein [Devosia sp. SD17-2]|jgi:peptide/nickel transport system ATP-binding protein|uniref:ATP-binding cassette domain-containing protein n=1 Tax=Devosia sp. SD17-2 TaxID=2976459 RepID=UPI0023D82D67|nr:ATP-binding cassette domain-containing protein [Devosia sp. SD17-2]WEJ32896.1 ATP-binding cassette domain-containing protein [Devosia sp. SD17-2]